MKSELLYIKIDQNVKVFHQEVLLEDVAKLYCPDRNLVKELNKLPIMMIKAKEETKFILSILKIIEEISKRHPGVHIVNLGETDFVLDYKISEKPSKILEYLKTIFVSFIIFFGSAFAIMTFNTDVSVGEVFDKTYELIMGQKKSGGTILEVMYSIGIPVGIFVFFNHFSKMKVHTDPTPIQIQMRSYEKDINSALIEDAAREDREIDVN